MVLSDNFTKGYLSKKNYEGLAQPFMVFCRPPTPHTDIYNLYYFNTYCIILLVNKTTFSLQ